jgi:integrase
VTVGEWLDQWLELRTHDERTSPGTLALRRHHIESYWRPHLGAVRLDRLTDTHIARVRTWMKQRNEVVGAARRGRRPVPHDPLDPRMLPRVVSDGTWSQIFTTLNATLNEALKRGLIGRNPAKLVGKPRVDRKPARVWTSEEVRAFIDFVYEADPWLAPMFELALRRGVRRGELLGLQWGDVSWRTGDLSISRQRVDNDGHVQESTKTQSSTRVIPLGSRLVARLRELQLRRGRPGGGEWLFVDRLGRPPKPTLLSQYFGRLVAQAGLPAITLHNTRHTAATLLLEGGARVKDVATILGHSSVRTTMDTYQVVTKTALDDAVERLDVQLDHEGAEEVGQNRTSV